MTSEENGRLITLNLKSAAYVSILVLLQSPMETLLPSSRRPQSLGFTLLMHYVDSALM